MDLNVVEYKKRYKKEVLVGYYRGFPLSYYPTPDKGQIIFKGHFLEDWDYFDMNAQNASNQETMKNRVVEIINLYKQWVDYKIIEKAREDEVTKGIKDTFKDIVGDNDVVKEKQIPKIKVI